MLFQPEICMFCAAVGVTVQCQQSEMVGTLLWGMIDLGL